VDEPSLDLVWSTFIGYQRTAALKAAVELDLFTAIGAGARTVDAIAARCGAAARGVRALLNHLVIDGFLVRDEDTYALTATAAAFLDPSSDAYVGSAIRFVASDMLRDAFGRMTDAVRRGGTAVPDAGTLAPEHPIWVDFARWMAPLARMSAMLVANHLDAAHAPAWNVLDVAAGHGMFGITLAQVNRGIRVTAVDWANVLAVAQENAREAGVTARWRTIPGSAFDVDLGTGYDLVLLPNILHHFDAAGCERLLARAHAALAPGGRVAIVEFVPDDDRTGPPDAVRFALVMLATTPAGDAYTLAEYRAMLARAGFRGDVGMHDLPPSPARVVVAGR